MKKRFFSFLIVASSLFSYQAVAQVRESYKWDFETVVPIEGVNFQASYDSPAVNWSVTDNPVAEDGWDGADAEKDPINSSSMCLEVTRVGTNDWEGPSFKINGDKGVRIDPLNDATWFMHVQFLLPEGVVPSKGRAGFNLFSSLNTWFDSSTSAEWNDNWFIRDYYENGSIAYPADYESMTWVEFDIDLRPYMGKTFHWIQLTGEFGGSLNYFIDNLVIDNRAKNFPTFDFGVHVPICEEQERMYIFYPGTKQCITAQDQPASGYAAVQFCEYKAGNDYQVFNVMKDPDLTFNGEPLYTIEYDYSFLFSDGSLRPATDESLMRWFTTKYKNKPKFQNTMLINGGSLKYLKPKFMLDGVETTISSDTTEWVFIKESDVEAYLATTTVEVEKQMPNGDYYIFYAGTNYCISDRRMMGWEIGLDGKDSIYYPISTPRSVGTGRGCWPIVLEEFDPSNNGQQWSLRSYSEDVDNDYKRTFFKWHGARDGIDGLINGHPQLVTERWHFTMNQDSTTRAVGARIITGKPYDLEWIDVDGESKVVKDYCSVFGNQAYIFNDDNNQSWFVKQVPVNKDGISAIYSPFNGYQGTALRAKYAGGALYATPYGETGNIRETQIYCWKFVSLDDPRVQSFEASKALISKDTVFGYPAKIEPGDYRIVYRGTNQVLAKSQRLDGSILKNAVKLSEFDKNDLEQLWTIESVVSPIEGYKSISDQYLVKNNDGEILYAKPSTGDYLYSYPKAEATARGLAEEDSYVRFLSTTAPVYGEETAYIMVANNKIRKYLLTTAEVSGAGIYGASSTGTLRDKSGEPIPEFPFVLVKANDDLPSVTREFAKEIRITPGFYYVQYAFANDAEDKTRPYVLCPPNEDVNDAVTRNMAYDPMNTNQLWYITYSDTAAIAAGETPESRYILFTAQSVADTLAKGASDFDLINSVRTDPKCNFIMSDWNRITNYKEYMYSWFTYRFYEKDGKIALKEANHNQWVADHVSLGSGIYALKGDPARSENGTTNEGWTSQRIHVFHLIPSGEELQPVSEYAPWHPLYGQMAFTLGDVNGDGKVNVSDVVATVNAIIGNPAGNFVAKAADMNEDGKVNISDVVSIVNEILTPEMQSGRMIAGTGTGSLAIEGGKLLLTADANVAGFDFAYEGDIFATETLRGFDVIPYVKEGKNRVIVYSITGEVVPSGTNVLFTTRGSDLTISDAIFVAQNATELVMDTDVVTSEEKIATSTHSIVVTQAAIFVQAASSITLYNVDGVKLASVDGEKLSTATITPGTYFVKAITESGELSEKIVIK